MPIFLAFAFLLQTFSYLIIYADYEINKNYIAKNLCENKDRPELKCEGKCQLCKKMKTEDTKQNKGLPSTKTVKFTLLYSIRGGFSQTAALSASPSLSSVYRAGISSVHTSAVFHPPLG